MYFFWSEFSFFIVLDDFGDLIIRKSFIHIEFALTESEGLDFVEGFIGYELGPELPGHFDLHEEVGGVLESFLEDDRKLGRQFFR